MAMWIRQLDVADCAGIKAASVSLQPGLNVLHGPNELGKSTLVKAIRATLLLPAGATAGESLRAWNVDAAPSVALTFEQEAQRIWRIRKRFGTSGSQTYLGFSRDGKEFSQDGRGREVEGSVQNILRWGIEPPGGRSGKRGMPESFITTALLGDQRAIDAILKASLKDDPNATGRDRLTDALQAMAEDPRFKQVLAVVQERFDEAFTATGRHRIGRASPWHKLREDRQRAEQRELATRQEMEQSEAARNRVADLQRQAWEAEAEAERAAGLLKAAQMAQQRRAERATAATALAAAEAELHKAQAQVRGKDEKVAAAAAAEQEAEALRESLAVAEKALAEVQPLAKAAADRVQQLESADAEQGRRLREQEAQNQRLQLARRKTELETRVAQAGEIAERETATRKTRADIETRTKALAEQCSLLAQAEAKTVEEQREVQALERDRDCARYLAAKQRASALMKERDAARELAKSAKSHEDKAQEIRAAAEALHAPTSDKLDELRKLHTDSQVANAKLDVGLAIEFTPASAGTARVTVDGNASQRRFNAGERLRYEAERELQLAIDGVGELQVRGGGRHAREEAAAATDRWRTLADALCDSAGVATSAELVERRGEADRLLAAAEQNDSKAQEARLRSENLDELERRAVVAQAEAEQRQAAAAKRMADGVSVDDHLKEHGELPDEQELTQVIETRQDEMRRRESLRVRLAHEVEQGAAEIEDLRQNLQRAEQELREAAAANEQWRRVLDEADAEGQRLDEELAKLDAQIKAIQAEATTAAADARQALAKITAELSAKTKTRDERKQRLHDATNALARLQGEAATLRATVEALDVVALLSARDEKRAALDALPLAEDAPDDVAELEHAANDATNKATALRHDLSTAQGALGQVGGQRTLEQAAQAKEALATLARREHELEVEYGGWQLLRETLAEAEKEDATHLGDALVKPVSERMAALTGGRYSAVGIGPQLDATNIRLGEDDHSFDDVSVGTREQIALLLRLAIAEALGSFVILDDHLTQSDAGRMARIRGLLGEAAQKIQVIVMTCHPDAYLTGLSGDRPINVHAVDLTERIKRHDVAV